MEEQLTCGFFLPRLTNWSTHDGECVWNSIFFFSLSSFFLVLMVREFQCFVERAKKCIDYLIAGSFEKFSRLNIRIFLYVEVEVCGGVSVVFMLAISRAVYFGKAI